MNYEQCLKYLERIQNLGIKFGLDNVRKILASLGNPQKKYPTIIVGGTNGKGSVCAMLTRILSLSGFRTGLFTSPHLVYVEERIRIGDELISRKSFSQVLTTLKEKIDEFMALERLQFPPTYFEILTCLAFLYFSIQKVDMAVLEVGMGGRFDATNVVKPIVSVITTISHEHQKFLGNSLSKIAFEKAGIIKQGIPVICGVERGEAYETIRKRALEFQSPFSGVFDRKGCFLEKKGGEVYSFFYQHGEEKYTYTPSLLGEYQGKNAAIVIFVCGFINENWKKIEKDKVIQGIESTRWEGRLDVVSKNPLILVDGAHNEEGAESLRKYILDFVSSPVTLVFAVMRDKKIEKLADILFPLAKKVILTRFPYFRAATPEEMKERVPEFRNSIKCEPDVKEALEAAIQSAGSRGAVVVAGSIYLAGEVKKLFP